MTDDSRTRMKVAGLIAAGGAVVLLLSILTVRSVLLTQVDRGANQAIRDEVHEFIAYVDGAQQIGDGDGEQFDSEADLMRGFLARQTPETHEMLVAVSGGETMFLDNTQDGMGQRFVEDSPEFDSLLQEDAASGVQESPGFGEIRWGKVTTDQEGAFLVLHFTTPAEEEAAGMAWTFTWVSALALLLVSACAWFSVGLLQQIRDRRGRRPEEAGHPLQADHPMPPVRPMPEHPGDPTVPLSDLLGGPVPAPPQHEGPTGLEEAPAEGSPSLRRTSAASLMLRIQDRLRQLHPQRRFILTLDDEHHEAGHTAEVLGALAQIEGEIDPDAVESEFLALVSAALEDAEPQSAVVLGAGRSTSDDGGQRLRLSVSAGSPETSGMEIALDPPETPGTPEEEAEDRTQPAGSSARAVVYPMR